MNAFKLYTLSFFTLFTVSCNSQNSVIEENLKNCINEKLNKNIKEFYGKPEYNFYDLITKVEEVLLAEKLLANNSKNSYRQLVISIGKNNTAIEKEAFFKINKVMDDYGFKRFSTETIFSECPYKSSNEYKSSKGKTIYDQGVVLSKLMAKGYNNNELLGNLLSTTNDSEFDKIVYRAPIILITAIMLDKNYRETNKSIEKYKKGKKPAAVKNN